MEKTNVMRILDAAGADYRAYEYDPDLTDAELVAAAVGKSPDATFKTLVTVGASGGHYVFLLPANCTLQLKKAAKAVGEKSIAMLPQRELFPLTGYVHGGCSPIGMKKRFPTRINDTAELFPAICFSAGRRGAQVEMDPAALSALIDAGFADLTEE